MSGKNENVTFDAVKPMIEQTIEKCGAEMFDARFFGAHGRSVLRITIDKQGGVSIADCEEVSREVGKMLDEQGFFGEKSYTLEVSSPGIDRPLKTERDFKRIVNKNVTVNLKESLNGKKVLKGVVDKCEDGVLYIIKDGQTVEIKLDDITSGKEEISFK